MIWIIGHKGMLGTELSLLLKKTGILFIGTGREVDITDMAALMHFIEKQEQSFDWIVNCAAYTAVDKAEDEFEACHLINTIGAANIAINAKKINARLIHISTDYVFDGIGKMDGNGNIRPYREDDSTNPCNVYGITKRDGELEISVNNPHSYIIRTAWLYGKYGNNFVNKMLRLMNERSEVKVVNDQRGSPTWTYDLAVAIIDFIKFGKDINYGIYHYTNKGNISWYDFAKKINQLGREYGYLDKDCTISSCTSVEFHSKIKRPVYSVLDITKTENTLKIKIPLWDESLNNFIKMKLCDNLCHSAGF
ncbi:MAG: dTDP-4-dehydrorhamnose reductase [Treponema sp.]|nr:dTDP-4-dehydrorhamnose reductase [Treponema sp.]